MDVIYAAALQIAAVFLCISAIVFLGAHASTVSRGLPSMAGDVARERQPRSRRA